MCFLVQRSQSYDDEAAQALSTLKLPDNQSGIKSQEPVLNFLYDRVYPVSGLEEFNRKDNISHADHFLQAWDELYRSATEKNFPTAEILKTRGQLQALEGKVSLSLIDVDFYRIKPTAVEEGLVKVEDERLYHV